MPAAGRNAEIIQVTSRPIQASQNNSRKRHISPVNGNKAQQNNIYWGINLADTQIDPRRLDLIRSNLGDLQKVTAADVQREVQTYLLNDKAWKFLVVPQDYVLTTGK